MLIRYILPLLAVLGFGLGVLTVLRGNQPVKVSVPVAAPSDSPYTNFIAGSGIIEARNRNILIGSALPGLVKALNVRVGDKVQKDDVLFSIDDRDILALVDIRKADLVLAQTGVKETEALQRQATILLQLAESVEDRRAISREDLEQRRNAVLINNARILSAKAQVRQAESQLAQAMTTLERLKVRAPRDGQILQVNIRPGEYAQAGPTLQSSGSQPLVVMGNLDQLHVRVDIDENDVWRFDPEGKAIAYLRGNRDMSTPLKLAYVEPYVVPKRSLTGDSNERVDTRVLQVLYEYDPGQLKAFVGQQLDIFIEAQGENSANEAKTPPSASLPP